MKKSSGIRVTINTPEVTAANAPFVERELSGTIVVRQNIILNLDKIQAIDSWGLSRVIRYYKDIKKVGGSLRIINVHPEIHKLMLMIKLNDLVKIQEA